MKANGRQKKGVTRAQTRLPRKINMAQLAVRTQRWRGVYLPPESRWSELSGGIPTGHQWFDEIYPHFAVYELFSVGFGFVLDRWASVLRSILFSARWRLR